MIYLLLLVLGLIFGSFISVVTYRIPRDLDFIKGRSFCDSCKAELTWYDNVPLFSYLYYGGKSRCCSKKISPRYPIIEITSAIGAVALFYLFPFWQFTIHYSLFIILLSIFIIDTEHQIIPDELSWLILFLGLINFSFTNIFSGFLFAFLFLILFLITSGRGMGLGDVKLAIPLGLLLGLEKGLVWILTTFILGGIIASVLLILKRANLKTKIAFGPFMVISFWIVLLIN